MVAKPAAKPAGKKSSGPQPTGDTSSAGKGDDDDLLKHPPENKEQVLQRVSFEGLPVPSADIEEAVAQLLNIKYETLTQIFAHYCKMSECKNVKMATSLRLGARVHARRRRAPISAWASMCCLHAAAVVGVDARGAPLAGSSPPWAKLPRPRGRVPAAKHAALTQTAPRAPPLSLPSKCAAPQSDSSGSSRTRASSARCTTSTRSRASST
jgi:hypothetical protein